MARPATTPDPILILVWSILKRMVGTIQVRMDRAEGNGAYEVTKAIAQAIVLEPHQYRAVSATTSYAETGLNSVMLSNVGGSQ